ncbi:2,3-bisphosphoglycerate-independent phosphoglycerate mutase [Rhodosalinus sp. 5P4]|uniref:2,3-bisphosphoglycerate-independent phosphoglycerate mutase n=1 Tax=Rhodosalinus sp. 5P4 TaxID=3239196 RepID=UPI003523A86C
MGAPKPVVLCILDGWGLRAETEANAPALAHTPNFDQLMAACPNATLVTHGPDVGLPEGQMGNSEVGHMNIGAGRVVTMDLGRIDAVIAEGRFAERPALRRFIEALTQTGGIAHLWGLVSDGGVHGSLDQMLAAARAITDEGVAVAIHALTDGRDVAQKSAAEYVARLEDQLPQGAYIATVTGRYYAMDRDNRWDRIALAFETIVQGKGPHARSAADAVAEGYAQGLTDEFFLPTEIGDYTGMADGDGVFCLNFRADRAREFLRALAEPGFDAFETGPRPALAACLGMVSYSDAHDAYMDTLFETEEIANTLGAWVAAKGLRQFRLAETEKYPHVTFFLSGGEEVPAPGEERYMAPSPPVATYDLAPEMSAGEVTDQLVEAIGAGYDLIVVNYANPDMVGHTGDLDAAIRACEAVDEGLGRVRAALAAAGGAMIVTADHGNCEVMVDPDTGAPHTAHTTNPVPVILVGGPDGARLRDGGRLADLAPTVLELMDLEAPPEMTGRSLIAR